MVGLGEGSGRLEPAQSNSAQWPAPTRAPQAVSAPSGQGELQAWPQERRRGLAAGSAWPGGAGGAHRKCVSSAPSPAGLVK